jgi:hypothetical protein
MCWAKRSCRGRPGRRQRQAAGRHPAGGSLKGAMPPAVPEPTKQFQTNFKNPFHNNIQSKAKALRLPDKNAARGADERTFSTGFFLFFLHLYSPLSTFIDLY